jgi:hypothetical protein
VLDDQRVSNNIDPETSIGSSSTGSFSGSALKNAMSLNVQATADIQGKSGTAISEYGVTYTQLDAIYVTGPTNEVTIDFALGVTLDGSPVDANANSFNQTRHLVSLSRFDGFLDTRNAIGTTNRRATQNPEGPGFIWDEATTFSGLPYNGQVTISTDQIWGLNWASELALRTRDDSTFVSPGVYNYSYAGDANTTLAATLNLFVPDGYQVLSASGINYSGTVVIPEASSAGALLAGVTALVALRRRRD